ncbi:molybdopterin/thiamine biosynthesis adenylyltransferase [Litoreibacter ponti]|uniref:Molybdopterin/thiamine biosynthesis adenylyltransferase n=1 Tax=Litoreibacter ponti TaxID=1510457 RepID=A0A2T6BJ87_9RHOB|nr:HesA/MoeB/ThiF family protein [Litoreibacter ponti]PTX56128.1 molybdopterin/thiamine biosynthesis adenylyltransferase [Litoreibacter ponti]
MSRYARQEMLPEIGAYGQAKLAATHALVVGAGGLAAPVLPYLVGAGVGRITLVDPDVVSLSNLHRQVLFSETDIGQPKARVAAEALHALNAEAMVTPIAKALTPSNAADMVNGADIVLDCADSFAASYILSDSCLAANTPLISASVLGFEGYVGGFCATAPSLRAVFPDLPARAATCATAGVMGPVVGTLGAMQAQMALSTILNLDPSPLGQLMMVNMRDFRTSGFRFDGAAESSASLSFIAADSITRDDFVVELRGTDEAPTPVTENALRLDLASFQTDPITPATGQRAVLTCRSGLRAWQAARALQDRWSGDISLIAMGDPAPTKKRQ